MDTSSLQHANSLDMALAWRLLSQMKRIRAIEESIANRYADWEMRCPTHLSIGQEAVPAAIAEVLTHQDYAVSTHRGHAHYLGKGGNLDAMIAELHGKATGCARGKGGSMHLIDRAVGFMGTSAIVGNSIPIGVGLGLAQQQRGNQGLSCIFLGDGAIEEGVFYESANFSAVKCLPVLFACENNLYSVYASLKPRQPAGRSIAALAAAIGVPSATCDGNDALACHKALVAATAWIRQGKGPFFLEFSTYRWREHCGHNYDDHLAYRDAEEIVHWKARDPIARLQTELVANLPDAEARIAAIEAQLTEEIEAAFNAAHLAPFPEPAEAYMGVYAAPEESPWHN